MDGGVFLEYFDPHDERRRKRPRNMNNFIDFLSVISLLGPNTKGPISDFLLKFIRNKEKY